MNTNELAKSKRKAEREAFIKKLDRTAEPHELDSDQAPDGYDEMIEIVKELARELGQTGTRLMYTATKGSFNCSIWFRSSCATEQTWLYRFPWPEHGTHLERHRAEVATMKYLAANRPIPLAPLLAHGEKGALDLPYLILEEVPGVAGDTLLPWSGITKAKQQYLNAQVVDILFHLSRCRFDRVGMLSMRGDAGSETFEVTGRPLTLHNQLIRRDGVNVDSIMAVDQTYSSARDYLDAIVALQMQRFIDQPNAFELWETDDPLSAEYSFDVRWKFYFRHQYKATAQKWAEKHIPDVNIYTLRHTDFTFGNLLVDPTTFKINAVLDWDFAVDPIQFLFPALHANLDSASWSHEQTWLLFRDWYQDIGRSLQKVEEANGPAKFSLGKHLASLDKRDLAIQLCLADGYDFECVECHQDAKVLECYSCFYWDHVDDRVDMEEFYKSGPGAEESINRLLKEKVKDGEAYLKMLNSHISGSACLLGNM